RHDLRRPSPSTLLPYTTLFRSHYTASGIGNVMNDRYKLLATKDLYPEFFWFTKYGFLGVHLFFMISGFVILASALNRSSEDDKRAEEHTSELQSRENLVCRLLL